MVAVSDNWVVEDPKKKVNWFDLFNPRHLKIIETNAFQDYETFFESKSHTNYMCNHPTKGPFVLSIIEVKEEVPEAKTAAKGGKATLVAKAKKEPPKMAYRALIRSREVRSCLCFH